MSEALKVLVDPLFKAGAAQVYTSTCCGRVYAGLEPAQRCRTCEKPIVTTVLTSVAEAEAL